MAALFLDGSPAGARAFAEALDRAAAHLVGSAARPGGPTTGARYAEIAAAVTALDVCPEEGMGLARVLDDVAGTVLPHTVAVTHPDYAGHLHCAPMIPSLAAELLISATNQSLDSFDQSPSATAVECHVVSWLLGLAGLGPRGDGVFTSGGTQSNLMGLLLARERHALRRTGSTAMASGLPAGASRWRVVCSEATHFSVAQAAGILGLGERAVVGVPCTPAGALDLAALRRCLSGIAAAGDEAIALVLTAGTTEAGAVDPLRPAAALAAARGLWVHVDAAAGGALLLSDRHRGLLDGIELADSVAIDFHKLLYQAVSASAFLVRDAGCLDLIRSHASYLNPDGDEDGPHLVGKSLQTTRRFDALKVLVAMRAVGRRAFGELVDRLVDLARIAAAEVSASRNLLLLAPPATNTVLFRWEPAGPAYSAATVDAVNRSVHERLWRSGRAVVGRAGSARGAALKLTLLSPGATPDTIRRLVRDVEACGDDIAAALRSGEGDADGWSGAARRADRPSGSALRVGQEV